MDYEPEIVHEVVAVEDSEEEEWTEEDQAKLLVEMKKRKRHIQRLKKLKKEGRHRREINA